MRARRLAIAGALALLAALGFAEGASACSCLPPDPERPMRGADAAIVGRLLDVVPRGGWRANYRYRVRRTYKGGRRLARGRVVSVRGAVGGAACGLPAAEGRSYGLLLDWNGRRWTGSLCGVVAPRLLAAAAGGSASRAPSVPDCTS